MLIHDLFRSSSTKHVWQAWLELVRTRPSERSRYHNKSLMGVLVSGHFKPEASPWSRIKTLPDIP